jgi:predicted DNA-binding transcriptional regulator AlpA
MICACPCRREFEPKRRNQIYLNAEHRQKDENRRWPVKRGTNFGAAFRNGPGERQEARASGVTPLLGGEMAKANRATVLGDSGGFSSRMLSTYELACFLGVSRWTLRAWRKTGIGPPFLKLTRGSVRYPRALLEKWIKEHLHDSMA